MKIDMTRYYLNINTYITHLTHCSPTHPNPLTAIMYSNRVLHLDDYSSFITVI